MSHSKDYHAARQFTNIWYWLWPVLIGVVLGCGLAFGKNATAARQYRLELSVNKEAKKREIEHVAHTSGERLRELFKSPLPIDEYFQAECIADAWLRLDAEGCLNFLNEEGRLGLLSDDALKSMAEKAVQRGLGSALSMIQKVESGALRDKLIQMAFFTVAEKDAHSVVSQLSDIPYHLRGKMYSSLAASLVARGGTQFVRELLGDRGIPSGFVRAAIVKFSETDPSGAVDAILEEPSLGSSGSLRAMDLRLELLQSVFTAASIDPAEKLKLVDRLLPSDSADYYRTQIVAELLKTRPENFETLLTGVSNPSVRNQVIETASWKLNPDELLSLVDSVSGTRMKTKILANAAARFARQDPVASVKWTQQISDPLSQAAALRNAMGVWMIKSPTDGVEYAVQQIKDGNGSYLSTLLPDLLSRLANNPKFGAETVDMAKLRDLKPATKLSLAEQLQAQLSPAQWKKLQPFIQ